MFTDHGVQKVISYLKKDCVIKLFSDYADRCIVECKFPGYLPVSLRKSVYRFTNLGDDPVKILGYYLFDSKVVSINPFPKPVILEAFTPEDPSHLEVHIEWAIRL